MDIIIIIVYILSLLYIFLFSMSQLHLTWIYSRKQAQQKADWSQLNYFEPLVTIQLPVYNEKYVVERLLDAVSAVGLSKK